MCLLNYSTLAYPETSIHHLGGFAISSVISVDNFAFFHPLFSLDQITCTTEIELSVVLKQIRQNLESQSFYYIEHRLLVNNDLFIICNEQICGSYLLFFFMQPDHILYI